LDTKGAFIHSTLHSGSVSQIVDRRVDLLLGNVWFCPVEDSSFIGAGGNTVPTPNAPVVIHHHDPIWFLPSGMDRTYLHTGGILTLLTLNGEIDESLLGNDFGIIVMFRVFEIDQISSFESENSDPVKLGVTAGRIVFSHTGIDASSAANTSRKLKAICPKSIGHGLFCTDLKFPPIFLEVSLFQVCNDAFLFFFCHFMEMFLQKVFRFLLCAGGERRKRKTCQGGQ
jgi:hypothetical protein